MALFAFYRAPGEGMIGEIATRVDAILAEDRERKTRLRQ